MIVNSVLHGYPFWAIFCFIIHQGLISSLPTDPPHQPHQPHQDDSEEVEVEKPDNYEEIVEEAQNHHPQNHTEEDPIEIEGGLKDEGSVIKAGLKDSYYRWPYKMRIQIDPAFSKRKRKEINAAIYTLRSEMKCFKFVVISHSKKLSDKEDYLYIKWKDSTNACNSGMGRWGGKMVMTITNGCDKLYGTAMHEMMHTLGFHHEHVRPDRDKWVKINWNLLKTDAQKQVWNIKADQKVFADGYDFDSVLHYPFSNILSPKGKVPGWAKVGQRSHLSGGDKLRLQKMYPCDKAPKDKKKRKKKKSHKS